MKCVVEVCRGSMSWSILQKFRSAELHLLLSSPYAIRDKGYEVMLWNNAGQYLRGNVGSRDASPASDSSARDSSHPDASPVNIGSDDAEIDDAEIPASPVIEPPNSLIITRRCVSFGKHGPASGEQTTLHHVPDFERANNIIAVSACIDGIGCIVILYQCSNSRLSIQCLWNMNCSCRLSIANTHLRRANYFLRMYGDF